MLTQQVVLAAKCILIIADPTCDNPSASQLLRSETVSSNFVFHNILSSRESEKLQIIVVQIKSNFSASTSLIYVLSTVSLSRWIIYGSHGL